MSRETGSAPTSDKNSLTMNILTIVMQNIKSWRKIFHWYSLLWIIFIIILLTTHFNKFQSRRKWRTTFVGILCLSMLFVLNRLSFTLQDLMMIVSGSAERLVLLFVGVFIAESVDLIISRKLSSLLIHHIFIIICFVGPFLTEQTLGFALAPVWIKLILRGNLVTEFLR